MGNRLTPEQLEALRKAMGQDPLATPADPMEQPQLSESPDLVDEEPVENIDMPVAEEDSPEQSLRESEQELEEEKVAGSGVLGFNPSTLSDPRYQEGSPERAQELLKRTARKEQQKKLLKDAEMRRAEAQRQKRQETIERAQALGIDPARLGIDMSEGVAELKAAQEASETLDYMGEETPTVDAEEQPDQFEQEPPQVDIEEAEREMQESANETAQQIGAQQTEKDIYELKQQKALQEYEEAARKTQELENELADEPLDSGRLWNNMSTGKKILLGISAAIAGYGYGLAGQPGQAGAVANMLENAVEQDLQMQIKDRENRRNRIEGQKDLMGIALQKFNTISEAKLAAKNAAFRKIELGMQQQLNNARTAKARANVLKTISDIQAKRQNVQDQLEFNSMMQSDQPLKESQVKQFINSPEAADLRERYVPGVGFATSKSTAERLQKEIAPLADSVSILDRLEKLAEKPLEDWSPKRRALADTYTNILAGRLRIPLTGGGPLTVEERKMIKNTIGNPAKIFGLDYVEKSKIKKVRDILKNTLETNARFGITKRVVRENDTPENIENLSLEELRQEKARILQEYR